METISEEQKTTISKDYSKRIFELIESKSSVKHSKVHAVLNEILHGELESYAKDIKEIIYGTVSSIGINEAIEYVSERYGTNANEMQEKTRERNVMEARQIVHWMGSNRMFGDKLTNRSVGIAVGRKDPATVIHSAKQVNNLIEMDKDFRARLIVMCDELGARTTWMPSDSKLLITGFKTK